MRVLASLAVAVLALVVLFVVLARTQRNDELAAPVASASSQVNAPADRVPGPDLPIDSQVTFLYYQDLDAASVFYEDLLGLEKTYDAAGARIYRTSASSYVGLVEQGSGYHEASDDKPVMVSLVTDALDEWYAKLVAAEAKVLSELADSSRAPVRAFLVEDPGGYTVEFFQWRQP